jgi:Restriction endonuclease
MISGQIPDSESVDSQELHSRNFLINEVFRDCYIYIQAKRLAGSLTRPEIQKFIGVLTSKKAKKIDTDYFEEDY